MVSPTAGDPLPFDLAKVRVLADSLPGPKASEVRVETILAFAVREAMIVAGDSWRATSIPVSSYQLVFPDRSLIIDTAMDPKLAQASPMVSSFDTAAYDRMAAALQKADLIVVTHEHSDHLGGLADDPHFTDLLKAVRLTDEQVANAAGLAPANLPAEAMKGYQPLHFESMLAIAPGVVLIKAPGHTPGSQLVYVKRADGRELLFVGDVAWHARSVATVRERPLAITLLIHEDRTQVLSELLMLHNLANSAPEVKQVPGHDGEVLATLLSEGYLTRGFK